MNLKLKLFITVSFLLLLVSVTEAGESGFRTVTDSRGVVVKVPVNAKRVVTVSDGFIESLMYVFGIDNSLVGVGSTCLQRVFKYSFPLRDGSSFTFENGMNPVTVLQPRIRDLPLIAESATGVHYERLMSLEPDLIIVRIGSCTLHYRKDEKVQKTIERLEMLAVPTVVLYGTNCEEKPTVEGISKEISIIGQVFGKEEKAGQLANYLERETDKIRNRVRDIAEQDQPSLIVLGLSPDARKAGGAGQVFGPNTIESHFIEEIAKAGNAFKEPGQFKTINAEQILALNPDAIVLCTANGYHPPRELYESPYYENLQELAAVKNRRIWTLPWSPCNCSKRLEYPIDAMIIAMAAHPGHFADVSLAEWLLDFYQQVYGVDRKQAAALRSTQWLDWTVEK